jgi:tRNA/tmRNA/rRNA uracil-C5-methylase (TrmA/RlmC/RlmD family)
LDIRCGFDLITFYLSKKASEVVGVNLNKKNIMIAKENYCTLNIRYVVCGATRILPKYVDFSTKELFVK